MSELQFVDQNTGQDFNWTHKEVKFANNFLNIVRFRQCQYFTLHRIIQQGVAHGGVAEVLAR